MYTFCTFAIGNARSLDNRCLSAHIVNHTNKAIIENAQAVSKNCV